MIVRRNGASRRPMWTRYRRWKHILAPLLVTVGLLLMRGEPQESARWYTGMAVAASLGIAYLAEEIVWIAQNRGRPCSACGKRIHLAPFSLRLRCPHCGRPLG